LRRFKFDKVKPIQNNKGGSKMKGSITLVMLSTLLVISSGVALAENGNMTKDMTMPSTTSKDITKNMTTPMNMTMPMKMSMNMPMCMAMPMNTTMPMKMANGSTNVIVLQNVTLNIISAQNLIEVTNTIITPSMTNKTKNTVSALNVSKPFALGKST
jgi:hypothetical protein